MVGLLFIFLFYIVLWIFPFAATFFLGYLAWKIWVHYVRQDFISGIDFVLLEIVPPRDVLRSPRGMELFFTNALYHFSYKGGLEEYWQGAVWFWFSLEIVSIDGQVHFFVRSPTRLRELIETQMYAQYPQSQVKVVEDYTLAVDAINPTSAWNLWGCEFKLLKPDAYPIKTYVDFGLDKDPKEEFKVDPVSPVIELFGSLKKGEQMWIQIIITPSREKYRDKGSWFKYHNWQEEAEIVLLKLLEPYTGARVRPDNTIAKEVRAPTYMDAIIKGISAKMQKLGFETGIRVAYVAKKEVFSMNSRRNLRLIWRQYESPFLNGFDRLNSTQADAYGGIFVISAKKIMRLADRHLHAYREREFFHLPLRHQILCRIPWPVSPALILGHFHHHTFVLNTEELATIWHFPGQILRVPTLERIESKEAAPPTNLPV